MDVKYSEMRLFRLTNCCGISCLLHLLAAVCLTAFASKSFLLKPKETVCFVDLSKMEIPALTKPCTTQTKYDESSKEILSRENDDNTMTPQKSPHTSTASQEKAIVPAMDTKPTIQQAASAVANLTTTHTSPPSSSSISPTITSVKNIVTAGTSSNHQNSSTSSSTAPSSQATNRVLSDVTFGPGSGPSFINRVTPIYPSIAKRFNREGKVVLRLTIDESGTLKQVEVLDDPGYGFAPAAVDAVKKSIFMPARVDGRPVVAKAILPVRFALKGIE